MPEETKKVEETKTVIVRPSEARAARRMRLKAVGDALQGMRDDTLYSRQPSAAEEDPFSGMYDEYKLLEPTYAFSTLYRVFSESDVLQECVDAMVQNIDGFGFQMLFLGDDLKERDSEQSLAELTKAQSFFNYANEKESWRTIRKLMRTDLEVLGNGGFEVVRNKAKKMQLTYQIPFQQTRMSRLDGRAVTVPILLERDGEMVEVRVKKYFRKYCVVGQTSGKKLRWFKAFGDPRDMDAMTGEYKQNPKVPASELMHFKLPFSGYAYGMPRWLGPILDVLGRRSAQFVNYDLFESQGIPPMAIMVSGGVLTDESFDEIEEMIRGMRGMTKWNRVLILEANVDSVGMEERNTAKITLENLSEYRKEDQMFSKYLKETEETIRRRYRLPPLYVGGAETFTHATAKAAQTVAEEQVFIPEREEFDEAVNRMVLGPELGITRWSYRSKGPRAISSDELSTGVRAFVGAGGITVNHSIDLANRAFGLEMSKYEGDWANYPINLVLEMVKMGRLKGMDAIDTGEPEAPAEPAVPALPPAVPGQRGVLPVKVLKSDMFNEEEKRLYKRLLFLQDAIDRGMEAGDITDEDLEQEAL